MNVDAARAGALALADDCADLAYRSFRTARRSEKALGTEVPGLLEVAEKFRLVSQRIRDEGWVLESALAKDRATRRPTTRRQAVKRNDPVAAQQQRLLNRAKLQDLDAAESVLRERQPDYVDPSLERRRQEYEEQQARQRQEAERRAWEDDSREARERALLAGHKSIREQVASERLGLIQAISGGSFEPPGHLANRPWTREVDDLIEKARTAAREAVKGALQADWDAAVAEQRAAAEEREQAVAELRKGRGPFGLFG